MDSKFQFKKRLCQVEILRFILILPTIFAVLFVFQYYGIPGKNSFSLSPSVVTRSFKTKIITNSSTIRNHSLSNPDNVFPPPTRVSVPNPPQEPVRKSDKRGAKPSVPREDAFSALMSTKNASESLNISSKPFMSISDMNFLLLKSYASSGAERLHQKLSDRDRELLSARFKIEDAPAMRTNPRLHASVFRNVSKFQQSYELMEQVFKIYVYKEGDRPIFNEPLMVGIYASEGWFMKLLKQNKMFTVRDPDSAHSFYIPFSSIMFRKALRVDINRFDLEGYLEDYIELIAKKYPFWNRTKGADHFVVGCHDWAPRFTTRLNNSIRSLCNADIKKGFRIGKDTSLPVTNVRDVDKILKDIGGWPPSKRSTLAFFAGRVHGYLRPKLLKHWHNKVPDMAIFGRLPRNSTGSKMYKEYMKSSKYCICARGTSVHTPRVVESILYECVPVILADNYIPPFFEVLKWDEFAVFVKESDIPNLRNILLSIPRKKYLSMQKKVKLVQQHFLWHKKPAKYDLFHMILHSIWFNRVFNV